ncbi:hypothetical protein [Streptomyces sp. NPDC096012]|uniref:hypothetical protein n=1 Tax=Streptomyces sp. NPDC096012 TaxID=3155684 RepID=UPI003369E584
MRHRHALLPAFAVTTLFLAAACSSAPTPHAERLAAGEHGQRTRVDDGPNDDTDHPLTVAAAPAATAAATASPQGSGRRAHKTTLTVSSYDGRTRRAVISDKPKRQGSSPGAPASGGSSAAPHRAAVGDVIASAPASGAPHGLLAKVTKVIGETGHGTAVQTEPATLDALLGDDSAHGDVPVDPSSFTVDKLLPDVKVSWSKAGDVHAGPKGATVPLGSLRLDVSAAVPTAEGAPVSATASVHGFVQVAPQVDFAYGGAGTGTAPGSAYLGVSGDWASGWAVKGRVAAATGTPLRLPFAKLHADPVLQVGPVPVVVNLDLTCYVQISGDGRVTVDVEQSLKGDFRAGGTFGAAKGWTPVSDSTMTGTPVHASLTTAGDLKTALGAEASVGLYGTVGVTADLAPYLRGTASGTVTASTGTGAPKAEGTWSVYGGVDLSGTLRLQLSIFGTPVIQRNIPLGALHREWNLAAGSL